MSHPTHRCWIPAFQNVFSSLAPFSFNFFDMLVPDFMHEFELGIWKALFMHLVHILVSHGDSTIQEFIDDIGRFPPLEGPLFAASLKMHQEWRSWLREISRISSRCICKWLEIWITFNGVQKCAMPVFDGFHNNDIQSLLFTTAEWHTLAKMCLHTDSTLAWLDESMKAFRKQIRRFQSHTCSFFDTQELPQEEAACSRRQKKKKVSINLTNPSPRAPVPSTATPAGTRKKNFNLILIKLHALGDYVKTIKTFGTTDSYSTQPVWMFLLYLLLVLI